MIDAPSDIMDYKTHLTELGPLKHHYFTHSHKVIAGVQKIDHLLGVKTERPGLWQWDIKETGLSQKQISEDLTIVYTPGHTNDSVFICWLDGGITRCFTGDTLFLRNNSLFKPIVYSTDNKLLNQTLKQVQGLHVDWVYGSVSDNRSTFGYHVRDNAQWIAQLNKCIAQTRTE